MKYLFGFATIASVLCSIASAQNVVVLVEDNFDDTLGGLKSGNNSAKVTVTEGDPTGSGRGNVGSVDIGNANGTSVWGEVRGAGTSSGTFDIPAQAIAGTDTYTLSVDIYIPSDTTFNSADGADRFNMILRWNGVNTNNSNVRHNWDSLAADQWHTVTLSGTLPTLGGDGLALTTAIPILSFYDKTNDAVPGVAAYIDNFSIEVTTSAPEDDPNFASDSVISFGEVTQGAGPFLKKLTISNTGASEQLEVTGATLSGANQDQFSIEDAFPLQIGPSESADIEITFNPDGELGLFEATVEIASNDENVLVDINGTVTSPPIDGGENVVVLVEDNFDDTLGGLNTGNNSAKVTVTEGDPTGSGRGNVGSVDIGNANGTSVWGEVRAKAPNSGTLDIPVESVAGTDTYTVSVDIYIPSDTTFNTADGPDRFNMIMRWNGVNTNNHNVRHNWDSLAADQWHTVTLSNTLPTLGGDGLPLQTAIPILSFYDMTNDAVPGVAAYIDNFSIKVTIPDEDPNLAAISVLTFGEVTQGEGPFLKKLTISNTGSSEKLTISGATFSGVNEDDFSFPDETFPLQIEPGQSVDIGISFDPGVGLGLFEAMAVLVSNDENDQEVFVELKGTVTPPFNGEELIINGDFELGDLTGWRDNARFNYISDPVHGGDGAAVFNLAGGAQWGESRLNASSPPATVDDPQAIEITPDMIGKTYEYNAWYYRPSVGGMAADDTVRMILRWNKNNTNATKHGLMDVGDIPVDTWFQVTAKGVIPEVGGDGEPTTSVIPIWSFQDVNSDAAGGELMYIDDVSLKIEAPPAPDPLKITSFVIDNEKDEIRVSWNAVLGGLYAVDRTTALAGEGVNEGYWEELDDSIIAEDTNSTFIDFGASSLGEPKLFYRVRLISLPE